MADAPIAPLSSVPAGDDDPFQRLHKMSITAGLGSGDYVAISGLAIAAVLLGVASALVLFHIRFLLLVPIAGVVCAVLAWRQVGQSNGTLTGRGLAVLGLALSLGLGGFEGSQVVSAWSASRSERDQVIQLIRDFGQDVVAGRFEQAYGRCDGEFRGYVSLPRFEGTWRQVRKSALLGNMTGIDWNGLLNFDVDPVTGQPEAGGMVLIHFDSSPEPVRTDMFFRYGEHGWAINRITEFFAPPGPKSPGAPTGKPQVYGPPRPS
jgi:hypothetical protein